MQWFSMDQKPSWFNNAAATGTFGRKGQPVTVREKFAATRERYTINTTVQTYTYEDEPPVLIDSVDEEPGSQPPPAKPQIPKFAIMFKGAKDGKIINDPTEPPHRFGSHELNWCEPSTAILTIYNQADEDSRIRRRIDKILDIHPVNP